MNNQSEVAWPLYIKRMKNNVIVTTLYEVYIIQHKITNISKMMPTLSMAWAFWVCSYLCLHSEHPDNTSETQIHMFPDVSGCKHFFHKVVGVCHIYCNFKLSHMCPITIIFGILKDENLASNNCFSYRNIFQNGTDTKWKIVVGFVKKRSKFYLVQIIW